MIHHFHKSHFLGHHSIGHFCSPFKVHWAKTLGPGFPDLFGWKFDQILYPLISGLWNGCHFIVLGGIQNPRTPRKGWDLCSLSSLIFLRGIEDCRLATKLHTLEALAIVDSLTFIFPFQLLLKLPKSRLFWGYWLTIVIASIAHQQLWLQELLVLQGVPFEAKIWQGALICD